MSSLEGCNRVRKPWPFSVSLNLMCGVGCWASDLGPWASTLPVNILAAPRLHMLCLLQVIGLCDCGGWGLQILHGEHDILQELKFTCRNMLLFSLPLSSGQKKNYSIKVTSHRRWPSILTVQITVYLKYTQYLKKKTKYLRKRMLPGAVHQRLMHRNPIICLRNAQNNPCDLNKWGEVMESGDLTMQTANLHAGKSQHRPHGIRPYLTQAQTLCRFRNCPVPVLSLFIMPPSSWYPRVSWRGLRVTGAQ